MGATYWPQLLESRILSDADRTDQSGSADGDVTNWDMADQIILCTQIGYNGKDTAASAYKLQWRDETDNPGGSFTDVGATGEVKWAASSNTLADDDTLTISEAKCTDRRSSMGFYDGKENVGDNILPDSGTLDLGSDDYSELQWALDLSDSQDEHQYTFQLYNTAQGAAVGVCGAQITVAYYNAAPVVTLNTADESEFSTSTPTLEFTGTDPDDDDIQYNIVIESSEAASAWVEERPVGDISAAYGGVQVAGLWRAVAIPSGKVWSSYDGGTWTDEEAAGAATPNWQDLGVNSNGEMVACVYSGSLYMKTGGNWVLQSVLGTKAWTGCRINEDGEVLACVSNGRVYYYDGSWWELQPLGDVNSIWTKPRINNNGEMVLLSTGIRIQHFDGADWGEQQPLGDVNKSWKCIDINDDGEMIAVIYGGRCYHYDGSSWSEVQPKGDTTAGWTYCAINNDGNMAAYAETDRGKFQLFDGASWRDETFDSIHSPGPSGLSIDFEGNQILTGGLYNGRLWHLPLDVPVDVVSGTDSGFANVDTPADTSPFNSGDTISFTVPAASALDNVLHSWRARGKDPNGSNGYGPWSNSHKFGVSSMKVNGVSSPSKVNGVLSPTKVNGVSS